MATVRILLDIQLTASAEEVYSALCDWADHSTWVPMTRVEVISRDEFIAYTGVGPLTLKDRMRVIARRDEYREVVVEKLGPVLHGTVLFRVEESGAGSAVVWDENLQVPYVPRVLSKPLALIGAGLFRLAFRTFSRKLR
jgi:carbon monoxide dehydrogenase subunit G